MTRPPLRPVGPRRPRLALAALALLGCKEDALAPTRPAGDGGAVVGKSEVVAALGACVLDVYRRFATAADALAAATAALAADDAPAKRDAAKAAWTAAMKIWQQAELFRFGPAGTMEPRPQALREEIYFWPLWNRCKVEEALVARATEGPDFAKRSVAERGLAVVEFLLFADEPDNACSKETSDINVKGTWAALGAEELARRKRAHAAAAAADVARRARALVDAWEPGKGDFLGALARAGNGSADFRTPQRALEAMNDALFKIERPVTDVKLKAALGMDAECPDRPCLGYLESRWARQSKDHVLRNLDGFETLAFGCPGPGGAALGFDDLLVMANRASVAEQMKAQLAAARQALAAAPGDDLRDGLSADGDPIGRAYEALRGLVRIMKSDFVGALDLDVPAPVMGDND